jgi:phosphonate transport system substrate-binding protein
MNRAFTPWLAAVAVFLWAHAPSAAAGAAEPQTQPFRFGFSTSLFQDLNENDAKAALKVWVETLARERSVMADPSVQVFDGTEALRRALQLPTLDGVFLTTGEYWALHQPEWFNRTIFGVTQGSITEEYLLLVHQASGITRLEELRGRSLCLLRHNKMSLARPWLDTLLCQNGLKPAEQFAKPVTEARKLTKTVLPVFFRQVDACVVTRKGFKTMVELNPQVGKQLKILASSPPLVPDGFFFRTGYPAQPLEKMINELARIHSTAAGQQVLTVFQTDYMQENPVSCLDNSMELLAAWHRLVVQPGQREDAK